MAPDRIVGTLQRKRSLRWRLRGWTAAAFFVTLAAFAAVGVLDERRRALESEAAGAAALLGHLAGMPAFAAGLDQASRQLDVVRGPLRATGSDIDLVPVGSPQAPGGQLLATQPLELAQGPYELRYRTNGARLAEAARRSVLVHAGLGLLTLVALLAGIEWILRRRVISPLHDISHQVRNMKRGGGWVPVLPSTDAEIAEVAEAVGELGPALGAQVEQWLEGERRAAVALAFARLRDGLRDPQRRALALLGDLQASDLVRPAGKQTVRAVLAAVEQICRRLDVEEAARLAPSPAAQPAASAVNAGQPDSASP